MCTLWESVNKCLNRLCNYYNKGTYTFKKIHDASFIKLNFSTFCNCSKKRTKLFKRIYRSTKWLRYFSSLQNEKSQKQQRVKKYHPNTYYIWLNVRNSIFFVRVWSFVELFLQWGSNFTFVYVAIHEWPPTNWGHCMSLPMADSGVGLHSSGLIF